MDTHRQAPQPAPTRRSFLLQTAALAGSATLLVAPGRRAAAAAGHAPRHATLRHDDEPIRVGIIGTGGMGTGHAAALLELTRAGRERVRIVALCDVCRPRLEHAADVCRQRQSEPFALDHDYRQLLARPEVQAVVIATPEHWHARMAIDAIHAGKDIYLEKPMTLRLDGALELLQAARARPDIMIQVGTQIMQQPKYRDAAELLASGTLGPTTLSQTSYCRNSREGEWLYYEIDPAWKPGRNLDWQAWCGPLGPRPWDPALYARWRRYRDFSTGIVGDLLVHVMTPLLHTLRLGWPTRVVATGGHYVDTAMENHDTVTIAAQFADRHTMLVVGSTANEVGLPTLIRCHRATIDLSGPACSVRPERIFESEVQRATVTSPHVDNEQDEHRLEWFRSIRTRQPPSSTVELGAQVMAIVDLATRSMWDHAAFAFDPVTLQAARI